MSLSDNALDDQEIALGEALDAIEGMLLSELDGFLAAIQVCPTRIPTDEWLPRVWTPDPDDDEAPEGGVVNGGGGSPRAVPDAAAVARLSELVLARFHRIGEELGGPDGYMPIFDVDERDNEVLWLFWIEGFNRALALRPDAWDPMLEEGSSAQEPLAAILTMTAIAAEECDLPEGDIAEITASAPDLIGECVQALYAWRTNPIAAPAPKKKGPKVGRNDLCPCGSGKKHKKCCGAA
jgi:uncharacterized protein